MIRSRNEMKKEIVDNCHDGKGKLELAHVLAGEDSDIGISFFHDDILEPGTLIGEHEHRDNEEIYFIVEGNGFMIFDGERYPVGPGDVSLVKHGHTHGIINSDKGKMRLLVIEFRKL